MKKIENPHDKFFKKTMTQKAHAVSFLKAYLSENITTKLDLTTLKVVKESFISKALNERFSDVIYQVNSKDKVFFIYVLFEHQSTVEYWMHLRLLGYIKAMWSFYLDQQTTAKKLPGIIPIVFYHGKQPWNISTDFQDMLSTVNEILEFMPRFKYMLMDFSPMSDTEIKGSVVLQLFLHIMKKIYAPDFRTAFQNMIPLFVELSKKKTGMGYLLTALKYLFESSELKPEDIEEKLIPAIEKEKRGHIMTLAEQLREEGKIKGKIEGKIEGKIIGEIKTLQELVEKGILTKEFVDDRIAECQKKLKILETKPKKEKK